MKAIQKEKCMYEDCGQDALMNNWCETHQYCADVLKALRDINYARLAINSSLLAGGDYDSWIAYLVVLPARGVLFGNAKIDRYDQLMRAIDAFKTERADRSAKINETRKNMGVGHDTEEKSEDWIVCPRIAS